MPATKKIPLRMCVGCRVMMPKRTMTRVVKPPEDKPFPDGAPVAIDFKGKLPGRGAYLCHSAACLDKARKSRALERALETTIPAEVFDILREQIIAAPPPTTDDGVEK